MIPEGWLAYKLSDLVDLIGGGTPKTSVPEYWNGNIPWLSVVDFGKNTNHIFNTEKKITEKGLIESSTKVLKKGYLVISARGTVGELAMLGEDMAFNQSCYGINSKDKTINDYIYYLIKHNVNQIKRKTHGAVFDTITRLTFENIDVQIPPDLREQSLIAAILSSLDDKIELNLQMNKTLEAIAQAIFQEMFKGGASTTLSQYIEINPSISIRKGSVLRYIEMSNLPTTGFSISTLITRPFTAGSKFQNHDTLLARITPCLENGKSGFVDFLNEGETAFGSTEFIVMRPRKVVSPYLVYLISRDSNFRLFAIKSMVGTSGRQRVQTDVLKTYTLPLIDELKMQKFSQLVKPLFDRIKLNTDNSRTLALLRDSLLPKLMTGKIRVV